MTPARSAPWACILAGACWLGVVYFPAHGPGWALAAPTLAQTAPAGAAALPALSTPPIPAQGGPSLPMAEITDAGPVGCPVQPTQGRVVLTQGYGVGSHAPAAIWGAVDLAVDGDGDGRADPAASWDAPIVATHGGTVEVALNSDPAGNHVWVNDLGGIWRTGYSHLDSVTVQTGQVVQAGEEIGRMGSTGRASGPHLDYQVWQSGVNRDPTTLVGCG
jgi:murein DD-endopeptidase MepM/ murein hydrolase activator NlpD